MQPRIADRFELEALVGEGGMGSVHRARDVVTGRTVALKRVRWLSDDSLARFEREAEILRSVSHPALVGYVAHGLDEVGVPFLAMEWLEGEDLAGRLERQGLDVDDALALGARVAAGLAALHEAGVLHRDVKPANVYLEGGDPRRARLLDFGVARLLRPTATRALTAGAAVIGTVGYMAPEQARGEPALTFSVDVFSLGCVLYECLAGAPAFTGEHAVAVLAKVLLEEPPRLRDVRPELGEALDSLVAAMMAKDPARRVRGAAELVSALAGVGALGGRAPSPRAPRTSAAESSRGKLGVEQRLAVVLLAERAPGDAEALDRTSPADPLSATVVAPGSSELLAVAARFGGVASRLLGGAWVVALPASGAASDRAGRATACALALVEADASLRVGIASGYVLEGGALPVGPVIDRAASLLHAQLGASAAVRLDAGLAGLVEARFEVRREAGVDVVVGARSGPAGKRLLGKVTACVGREKELALLGAAWAEALEEEQPRAALLVAPAGTGKSRLLEELASRLAGSVTLHRANADMMAAGAPLSLARPWTASLLGPQDPHRALAALLHASPDLVDFAAWVADLPDRAPGALFRSVEGDPRMRSEWAERAFAAVLRARALEGPILLLAEDLHWGDAASVAWISRALRSAPGPWMVLATTRPEGVERFPELGAGWLTLALGPLARRAAERLVRGALQGASDEQVASLVARAEGNPLFLEELVRAAAEGRAELPSSIEAILAARIDDLGSNERRVLRVASVFGERAWTAGIEAITGDDATAVDATLDALVAREWLDPARESSRPPSREVVFRHAHVREAAYARLPPSDRRTAHAAALAWLESAGEREPLLLADHAEHAEDPAASARWLAAAAVRQFGGLVAPLGPLSERGLHWVAAAPQGTSAAEARGIFLAARGIFQGYERCELGLAVASLHDALGALGSEHPLAAYILGNTAFFASGSGDALRLLEAVALLLEAPREPRPELDLARGWLLSQSAAWFVGQLRLAGHFAERLRDMRWEPDAAPTAYRHLSAALAALMHHDQPGQALRAARLGLGLAERMQDGFARGAGHNLVTLCSLELGGEAPVAAARAFVLYAEHRGVLLRQQAEALLAVALARRSEADAREATALAGSLHLANRVARGLAAQALTWVALRGGRREQAWADVHRGLEAAGMIPVTAIPLEALRARLALERGDWRAALASAERARALASQGYAPQQSLAFLVEAEALEAAGRRKEARRALALARDRLRDRAEHQPTEEDRAAYLSSEDAVRTVELAAAWGV